MIAWNSVQLVEVKITKKNWEVQTGTPFPQVLGIAQDCNLGQCLTSSRAETSKKIDPNEGLTGPNRGRNYLFCSNVVGCTGMLSILKLKTMKV